MSTTKQVRSSLFTSAFARLQKFITRMAAPVPAKGKGDLWQLYRLSRGSDSVRPAVIRQLAAIAAR